MRFPAITKLIRGVRAAIAWDKAEQAATKGEYAKSLSLLSSIYDMFSSRMPSDGVVYGVNMLCGAVAQKMGDYRMAAEAAKIALIQIDKEGGISGYDKNYLRYHCKTALIYCGSKLNDEELLRESASIDVEFTDLERKKIRANLLRNLPIQEWKRAM
ncbi:MAG TPA: hypothetical protein VLX44_14235 [Xanthobacteraceae bacterium]|nr:hypothetical protein [Xanthobacteraceae bacterium]